MQEPQYRSVPGGILVQDYDDALYGPDGMRVVTEREPTPEEWKAVQDGLLRLPQGWNLSERQPVHVKG